MLDADAGKPAPLGRSPPPPTHTHTHTHVRGVKAAVVRGFPAVLNAGNMPVICAFQTQSAPPVTPSPLVDPLAPQWAGGRSMPCGGGSLIGAVETNAGAATTAMGMLETNACCGCGVGKASSNQLWNLSQHGYGSSY